MNYFVAKLATKFDIFSTARVLETFKNAVNLHK